MAEANPGTTLGIVVGGGPAPGINGVISSATIEAVNNGWRVLGLLEGFRWLAEGNVEHVEPLTIERVSRIHFDGGSILRTSRENPTKDPRRLSNVVEALGRRGVDCLLAIGGDDTAFTASRIAAEAGGRIRVATVPKTIDNDLPLPHNISTFGFQTARHFGAQAVARLMEDARTTSRWYFVVTMGRKSGALALGIGNAAGATLTVIPEEFPEIPIPVERVAKILAGAVLKRRSMGRQDGVAVIAEGIAECFDPQEVLDLERAGRDEFGHVRLAEVDLGGRLRRAAGKVLERFRIPVSIVALDLGYELRCAAPIPFDLEYTRSLGYGAVKYLLGGGSGALIAIVGGKMTPIPFEDLMDPRTGKVAVRRVDVTTESYEVARKYMIRIVRSDLEKPAHLALLAEAAGMTPERVREEFGPVVA
ncbi:MAG TPA: diphosphate--fructose-6-phosphate 1-phosphotransferase [Planctomycetota bacterium]|jgi:6-phosphofructokinase 1|nr:diphosphate--fructose-6-phosphate 1-phosphotransferase [Planctomycetota bacterium]